MAGKPARSRAGMFSRSTSLRRLDQRTREGRLLRQVRADLLDHLGGPEKASAPQRLVVDAAAVLTLRIALALDRVATGGAADIESYDRHLAALINALNRSLDRLGLERPAELAELDRALFVSVTLRDLRVSLTATGPQVELPIGPWGALLVAAAGFGRLGSGVAELVAERQLQQLRPAA